MNIYLLLFFLFSPFSVRAGIKNIVVRNFNTNEIIEEDLRPADEITSKDIIISQDIEISIEVVWEDESTRLNSIQFLWDQLTNILPLDFVARYTDGKPYCFMGKTGSKCNAIDREEFATLGPHKLVINAKDDADEWFVFAQRYNFIFNGDWEVDYDTCRGCEREFCKKYCDKTCHNYLGELAEDQEEGCYSTPDYPECDSDKVCVPHNTLYIMLYTGMGVLCVIIVVVMMWSYIHPKKKKKKVGHHHHHHHSRDEDSNFYGDDGSKYGSVISVRQTLDSSKSAGETTSTIKSTSNIDSENESQGVAISLLEEDIPPVDVGSITSSKSPYSVASSSFNDGSKHRHRSKSPKKAGSSHRSKSRSKSRSRSPGKRAKSRSPSPKRIESKSDSQSQQGIPIQSDYNATVDLSNYQDQ